MYKLAFITLLALVTPTVETIKTTGLDGPNGFVVDKAGNLYIACERGKKVFKLGTNKQLTLVAESDSPNGLAITGNGELIVSNFFSGKILKITGKKIVVLDSTSVKKPADIKLDRGGNLFITEYEGNDVIKISPSGERTVFATGFENPFGLAFDDNANLFVANNAGTISKVNQKGEVSVYAKIPGAIAYLAYSSKTKKLYVPCFTDNTIYTVSSNGEVKRIAGTGEAGSNDGSLQSATFNGPNSVALSSNGTLYISDYNSNSIRKIAGIE